MPVNLAEVGAMSYLTNYHAPTNAKKILACRYNRRNCSERRLSVLSYVMRALIQMKINQR